VSLWFVDADKFTADERQEVFETWCMELQQTAEQMTEERKATDDRP